MEAWFLYKKYIETGFFMYIIFKLFWICKGIGPRDSKHTFLQGVMQVYIELFSDGLIHVYVHFIFDM